MKWMSVKDSLPEFGVKVIVFGEMRHMNPQMGGAYIFISERMDTNEQYSRMLDENKFKASYVTHWMPLPEKPSIKPNK